MPLTTNGIRCSEATMASVTVLIATIPGREGMLQNALDSVESQYRQPDAVHVEHDPLRTGAARTRNRGLRHVHTEYVAFLDDDDELLPHHIESLMRVAEETEADVVYPTPRFEGHRPDSIRVLHQGRWTPPWGLPFTEDLRQHLILRNNFIPVTAVVKTASLRRVGGFPEPGSSDYRLSHAEDWLMFRRLALKGFRFVHYDGPPTWIWRKGKWHTEGRGTS